MIIGVSGKIGSGKDTIGSIVQYLTRDIKYVTYSYDDWIDDIGNIPSCKIVKFADKLKDCVCIMLGCTREELEDIDFKNKELDEEWWYYKTLDMYANHNVEAGNEKYFYTPYLEVDNHSDMQSHSNLIKTTPRIILQKFGTEVGRHIHPNTWVNATMRDYTPINYLSIPDNDRFGESGRTEIVYPNWIITDMRFPNELKAVKDRAGISIRVIRDKIINVDGKDIKVVEKHPHISETALDNAKFDYTIYNNGTIEELIMKVKEILIKEKLL